MRRALACTTVLALALTSLAAAPQRPEAGSDAKGDLVTLRGCVSGSLLKSVRADPGTVVGSLTGSDRYRMIGSKAVKAQIKKANGALVDVSGRVRPVPHAIVRGKRMGKTSIGIGVTQGTTSSAQAPYTPTIEADSIRVVAEQCGPNP